MNGRQPAIPVVMTELAKMIIDKEKLNNLKQIGRTPALFSNFGIFYMKRKPG